MYAHYREATTINNEGVRLLDSGDITGAFLLFQRGVVIMQLALEAAKAQAIPAWLEAASSSCEAQQQQQQQTPRYHAPCRFRMGSNRSGGMPDEGVGYVFHRPLLLSTEFNIRTNNELYIVVLSSTAVICFNFALSCHRVGALEGRRATLHRAANLYHLTLGILGRFDTTSDNPHSVLKCLVLNNLAHLHYEHCEYAECQYCLQRMFDLILWTGCLDDRDGGNYSGNFLAAKESAELKLNLLHLHPPSTAGAA